LRRYAGFSAEEVADFAGVDRTNASRDLNVLAVEGKVVRIPGRPVLFVVKTPSTEPLEDNHATANRQEYSTLSTRVRSAAAPSHDAVLPLQITREPGKPPSVAASVQVGAVVTSFETLIGGHAGLKVAVQQAKAAILYPPRGLHTLLCGPSGVGKTTFARLMHSFALEMRSLPLDAPFVSFNCADYAGNPQLLMAHLFGVVRGAYTGADRDREGLVEQAYRGILFLDEVHRLPPEGQEMLFHLMDRERFRRLGDSQERQSSLLLVAATTEDPRTALLPTFQRRIPMTIHLPGLHERTVMERYELLRAFSPQNVAASARISTLAHRHCARCCSMNRPATLGSCALMCSSPALAPILNIAPTICTNCRLISARCPIMCGAVSCALLSLAANWSRLRNCWRRRISLPQPA